MSDTRYITRADFERATASHPTPLTDTMEGAEERFRLMRLCPCEDCATTGKVDGVRCPRCRGEGRELQEVATCGTPEAIGVAIVTLAREGEWEECPFGLLDSQGEKGKKWLLLPFRPSARNVSDAGRTLAKARAPIAKRGGYQPTAYGPPPTKPPATSGPS